MYFAAKFRDATVTGEQAAAIEKWAIIEKTGWSLEYVESLPLSVFWEFASIQDGKRKARK